MEYYFMETYLHFLITNFKVFHVYFTFNFISVLFKLPKIISNSFSFSFLFQI